jgi:transcriptional regulator with XRE-family HTH domain
MNALNRQFGNRLRFLRVQRQMTQEQLATTADISVDFLSLIERGRNAPSFSNIDKLARALKIPVKELFNFDENQGNDLSDRHP